MNNSMYPCRAGSPYPASHLLADREHQPRDPLGARSLSNGRADADLEAATTCFGARVADPDHLAGSFPPDPAPKRLPAFGAAFTLIELLAVVALMASLAAGIGLALRQPGESVSLQSAQTTLCSLLGAARGRAALSQLDARFAISANPADPGTYLRFVRVIVQDPANPVNWLAEENGVWLPAGVFVVPPAPASVPGNPAWPSSRRSTALPSSAQSMTINGIADIPCYCVQFTPRGTTGGGYLLLTIGHLGAGAAAPALVLDNPDNLRGVLLRPSGALTLINNAEALEP